MKRILVGVDGTAEAAEVVARAVAIAGPCGGRLRLVRSVPKTALLPFGADVPPVPSEGVLASARASLVEAEARVPQELRDGLEIRLGRVGEALCDAASDYGADLVVVGAHAHGAIARALGTTAAYVVDHAPCSVIVAHEQRPATAVDDAREGEASGTRGSSYPQLEAGAAPDRSFEPASATLREEHARLDRVYDELLAAYRSGDWAEVARAWDVFAPTLRAHMEREEHDVFAAFAEVDPKEAAALRSEHDALQKHLATLDVAIDLHAIPEADAEALIAALRAHAARESKILYPWLDVALGVSPAA